MVDVDGGECPRRRRPSQRREPGPLPPVADGTGDGPVKRRHKCRIVPPRRECTRSQGSKGDRPSASIQLTYSSISDQGIVSFARRRDRRIENREVGWAVSVAQAAGP